MSSGRSRRQRAGDRRRWASGAAIGGVVVGAAVAASAWAARSRRIARIDASDPCGPDIGRLPEGRSLSVTTDDGAVLSVLVAGPPDATTVVLPHCWTGSRLVWATVARRLVMAGHRVVLYDQRGHGLSTSSEEAPSVEALGHDLRAVMEATDSTDAMLVGHSMGGMTIQSYAALHPGDFAARTRGVVLVATAARTLGRAVPVAVVDWMLGEGRQEWTRRGRVGRAMVRRAMGQHPRRSHIDLTLDALAGTTGAARAGFLVAMAAMDLREGLADIAVPVTVMVGTRDHLTPVRSAHQLVEAIPDAVLAVLPGAGHMLPLEAPDRIIDAINATSARADDATRGPAATRAAAG